MYQSDDRCEVLTVHLNRGQLEFVPHPKGLHYLDLEKCKDVEMMMASTIRYNYEEHSKNESRKTIKARKLQGMMGHL